MSIKFWCLTCGRSLATVDFHAGRTTHGPQCGSALVVAPADSGTPGEYDRPTADPPTAQTDDLNHTSAIGSLDARTGWVHPVREIGT